MSYVVEYSAKARIEIADGLEWYEEEQDGLGEKFETKIYEKIQLIAANPFHYPLKRKYREAMVDSFPFLIVYNFNEIRRKILIVSVFHTSRNPKRKYRP